MGDRLTDAQQTAFTENGYLVLDGLLDASVPPCATKWTR